MKSRKRETTLSVLFLKYLVSVSFFIVLAGVAAIAVFAYLLRSGRIYPANYVESEIALAEDRIAAADEITPALIPELCRYVVFDSEGNVISGDIDSISVAWSVVLDGSRGYRNGSYYQAIPRADGWCVLKYRIIPQFQSERLRESLPQPTVLFTLIALLLIAAVVTWAALRFGRLLRSKLDFIVQTAERVQNQELDFSVQKSDVREINGILDAMDKMRMALKGSLEGQWKAEQARQAQISALAHDLKTPLTVIRGNAELMYDTPLSAEQKECTDYIDISSVQMQDYLQQLFEAARTGSVRGLHRQSVDAADFFHEISLHARGLCAAENITLDWTQTVCAAQIRIDREQLKRAVINVLSNAAEHTPDGGVVTCTVCVDAKGLRISVADSGSGFSPDALRHATEQFFMGEQSRMSKTHYGLGLYIAQSVVDQHAGRLTLENVPETGGARVTIEIPDAAAGSSPSAAE